MRITGFLVYFCLSMPTLAQAPAPVGSGPFPAEIMSAPFLPSHTIYSPADLDALGNETLPIVVWGNGACANANYNYREFLAEIASHGFLVVAIGPYRDSPARPPERSGPPEQWPAFATSTGQMIDAMNWALSMSDREDSAFAGHIETGKIAVMGHSCGGLQALEASYDSRVSTVGVLNSGIFDDGDPYLQRFSLDRSMLASLKVPVGYFIGGETDIAYPNAMKDWPLISVPSVMANLDVGHGATYQMPGGGPFARGPLAWLKWQLKNDQDAAGEFLGENCGLCRDNDWQLIKRGLD